MISRQFVEHVHQHSSTYYYGPRSPNLSAYFQKLLMALYTDFSRGIVRKASRPLEAITSASCCQTTAIHKVFCPALFTQRPNSPALVRFGWGKTILKDRIGNSRIKYRQKP